MTKRILFVGMVDSPHTARWINQISDQGWDLHIFPVYDAPAHPLLKGVTVHRPWITFRPRRMLQKFLRDPLNTLNFSQIEQDLHVNRLPVRAIFPIPVPASIARGISGYKTKPLGESNSQAPVSYGPRVLAHLIQKLKPDLIHSMEFQHAGYNVLRAKDLFNRGKFPKWLATNWGSDIYHYRNFADHRQQISRLLKNVDYYSCECERDIALARELGLKAPALPVLPNTGGFDIDALEGLRGTIAPSDRKILMVKGYQHFAGRALTALEAVLKCADVLKDWRIVVFSASAEVREKVEEIRMFHGLDASILEHASHEKMLRYFAHSRAYLGVSASDAISTAMLEAMAMGAFPIQTDTSCCGEWIENGQAGFSIPHDDVDVIADRLRRAATEDDLVDAASTLNWSTVLARLDQRKLRPQVREFYEIMLP